MMSCYGYLYIFSLAYFTDIIFGIREVTLYYIDSNM